MKEKESPKEIADAFNNNLGSNAEDHAKKIEQERLDHKKEAEGVLSYMIGVLSTGVIEVRIPKPRRKEKWAHIGYITSIITVFAQRKIKVNVAYGEGRTVKLDGKKQHVPYTDMYYLEEISVIKLVDRTPKEKKDEVKK